MTSRRARAPFWFELCVAVAVAVLCRVAAGHTGRLGATGGHAQEPQVAFWFFITIIANAIWKGLEVAGKVALEALAWSVKALWWFATTTANGLKAVGVALLTGLKKTWEFFRATYDDVLKPAWRHFWSWFDKFRRWLTDTIGPVLTWLRELRDNLLLFYKTFIRPWLDLIDVTRKLLRVFSSLGLSWAKALDAKLGALETAIEKPFRLVLAKLNEVITIVNRVVTLDGLLQRVALIRSLARDYQFAWRAITQPYSRAQTDAEKEKTKAAMTGKTKAAVTTDLRSYLSHGGGPYVPVVTEMSAQWRIYLRS